MFVNGVNFVLCQLRKYSLREAKSVVKTLLLCTNHIPRFYSLNAEIKLVDMLLINHLKFCILELCSHERSRKFVEFV